MQRSDPVPLVRPTVRLLATTALEPDFAEEVGGFNPLKLIEYAGRWDYGPRSVGKMKSDDLTILGRWLEQGEESMIEMVDVAFLISCSRVVSHELVRHRAGMSFQHESQRFVAYDDEPVDDLFITPREFEIDPEARAVFDAQMAAAKASYLTLRGMHVAKQIARYVLPNAMRTRIIAKGNLRAWRHILRLRLHSSAQPEMREVMRMVHAILSERFPEVFRDITGEERATR